jgi:3-oxoacyl-[acyl-carrier-protein] synthase III
VSGIKPAISAALRGTGSCVPTRVVPNDEFTATLDTSDEWIRTRTGIRERRYAGPNDTASSLAVVAARGALENARLTPDDLDLIVCATISPDLMCPASANLIQAGLGCRPIPSFDILAACSGFLYALSVGDQFIRTGTASNVLVVGAEVLSRVSDFTDRNTCILFGDGAGAAVLSATDEPDRGLRSIRLYSDGSREELIRVPGMVTLQPQGHKPIRYLQLNGREVFKFAVYRMIELIEEALAYCQSINCDIKLLIPHQVNQRIIDAALEACGFPRDKVMVNLDRYGNTSAASIPIAMDEAMRNGRARPGDTILLVAFGGGLTWGSCVITL